jgi:tripartite-type tricarboxylate transporter receptor subunit TctC
LGFEVDQEFIDPSAVYAPKGGTNMFSRRELLKSAAALPLLYGGAWPSEAFAQAAFPTRTITVVAPFPPGGVADYAARPLAAFLGQKLAKNVVVENKAGAGGGIGHTYVARAEPDGHTIMCALPSLAVIPEANRLQGRPVTYEATDFVPLARLFADPVLLVVKKEAKWRNIQELIDDIKKNPGKIAYGSSGVFGTVHLAQEMFLNATGLRMLHIPYQGGGPAVNAILSDQVPVIPTVVSNVKGQLDAGVLRPLVQFGDKRMAAFPNVPTCQDIGYKEVIYILWNGVFAPVKTPQHAQNVLRSAIKEFMNNPDVLERFKKGGTELGYLDGPDFAKFLEADTARLLAVARKIKLSS